MKGFITNLDWDDLEKPEAGDLVILKYVDAFEYRFRAIVKSIGKGGIIAEVDAVFDWQTKGPVEGDVASWEGKEITIAPQYIQDVVKKKK